MALNLKSLESRLNANFIFSEAFCIDQHIFIRANLCDSYSSVCL